MTGISPTMCVEKYLDAMDIGARLAVGHTMYGILPILGT